MFLYIINVELFLSCFHLYELSPVYTTEIFWHGSGESGMGPRKKRFGSDKICSVNNLSVRREKRHGSDRTSSVNTLEGQGF